MIVIYKILRSKACNMIFFEARAPSAFRAFQRGLIQCFLGYGLPQQRDPLPKMTLPSSMLKTKQLSKAFQRQTHT